MNARASIKAGFLLFAAALGGPGAGMGAGPERLHYAPAVTVARFEAAAPEPAGPSRIVWETSVELGVEAFRLVRVRADGIEVAGEVRAKGNEAGSAYACIDPGVRAGETATYELRLLTGDGSDAPIARWTGSVDVAPVAALPRPAARLASLPASPQAALSSWVGSGLRVRPWMESQGADRVRLGLRDAGIFRVTASELSEASGWPLTDVTAALAATNLALSCQGEAVAWNAEGDALLFYGRAPASRFAPENVYWVSRAAGRRMPAQPMPPPAEEVINGSFADTLVVQGTDYLARVSYSSLAGEAASYVAFPGPLLAGSTLTRTLPLPGCAAGGWTGTVTVSLLSYYEVGQDSHEVRVSVGGAAVGTSAWTGEQFAAFSYPFSSSNLAGGAATLAIANIAPSPPITQTDYTRFICLSCAYAYPRLYRATNGALRCTGGTGNTVAVSGFVTNDLVALDITDARQPGVLEPLTVAPDGVGAGWSARFPAGDTSRVYQVFSRSAGALLPSVRGVRDIDWSSPSNAAAYVILIPPEGWRDDFRALLQPLSDYRNRQGLETRIVDVESLYNQYSWGLAEPDAIRAFCGDGRTNWAGNPLRYLLLAGAGSLDFRQQCQAVRDYTACLLPPLIAGQRFSGGEGMTVPMDGAFGDVDGDGLPEVAVGRLPTTRTQDLAVAVQKTIAYESARRWRRQAVVGADWNNTGVKYYPFSAGTDRLRAPLAADLRAILACYPPDDTGYLTPVKTGILFPALRAESSLFHFFGHADELNFGGGSGKLLSESDINAANWTNAALVVAIACRPNRWHSLTRTVSIIPYGLFARDTGFVAGLGATGYMQADEGEELAVDLYTENGRQGQRRLGDVWLRGLRRQAATVPAERILSYSLVGDPALLFTLPRSGAMFIIK